MSVAPDPASPFLPAAVTIVVIAALVTLAAAAAFLLLYWIKSRLGIDFFPDRHLGDFFGLGD